MSKLSKIELLELWGEYKRVRSRIELPTNPGEERTVLSFINYIVTATKQDNKRKV